MDFYEAKILNKSRVENDIYRFDLSIPDGITWRAGGHMHIALPGFRDGDQVDKTLVRHMSIASLQEDGVITFLTRIGSSPSRFKSELSRLETGDTVTLFKFNTILKTEPEKQMYFLSMGVGMTSFYPLLRDAAGKGISGKQIHSLHVGKEQIYLNALSGLFGEEAALVSVEGRDAFYAELKKTLADPAALDGVYYIVGSDSFLSSVIDVLRGSGIAKEQIRLDKKPEKCAPFFEKERS